MRIDEAIEIQESYRLAHHSFSTDKIGHAMQLSTEALKLYMALKATGDVPKSFSGIGETED